MIRTIRFLGAALGRAHRDPLVIAQLAVFEPAPGAPLLVIGWVVAWIVLGFTLLPYLTASRRLSALRSVQQLSTAEFVTAIIGLFLGLLLGLLLGLPMSALPEPSGTIAPLGISVFLGLGDGRADGRQAPRPDRRRGGAWASFAGPPAMVRASGVPRILVDTSAIIDGRIADIADSGFLFGILEIPALRARRGPAPGRQLRLDAPDARPPRPGDPGPHAQDRHDAGRGIDEDVPGTPEVDSKLVALAKKNGRAVLTNDLNLNRIADLQGVRVLNVNSLANAVKPALLPGEELRVRVIQPGKDAGQGVGYLDDGTMVVVEGGAHAIDSGLDVTVTRVLQTVAGRMVFAHPRQG